MEDGLWILLDVLIVLVLVMLNALFVASEFAFVKVRGTGLVEFVGTANKRAEVAQQVISRLDAYLSACRLGTTVTSLGLGSVGALAITHLMAEPLFTRFDAPDYLIATISFAVVFGTISFLHIVLGKLVPISIAVFKAGQTSMLLGRPLMLFYKLTYPFIWLLNGAADKLLSWIGVRSASGHEGGQTEEEIRILMKESEKSGHISKNELAMVENVLDFGERVAREIMIPRTMFCCLYADLPFEDNVGIVQKERHSRFPVVEGDKDHIIGWVHASDVYNAALSADANNKQLRSFIRPLSVVPEAMGIGEVLKTMQQDRVQIVIVIDEFGGTSGLITFKDIIEEIVGDVHDEIREEREEVEVFEDRTSVDARMLIEKVNELFSIEIEAGEVDTIGGWLYSQFSEAPTVGQRVDFGQLEFKVAEVEHLQIRRIEVNALPQMEEKGIHEAKVPVS